MIHSDKIEHNVRATNVFCKVLR